MLKKLKQVKSRNQGFTIIEVMIVLAIAGLILLIVFLAVPALQRNARNTQRKNDAGNLVSAFTTFQNNNNGTNPTGFGTANAGQLDACAAGGQANGAVSATCSSGNTETAKLGYYATGGVYVTTATSAQHGAPTTVATGGESTTKVSTNSVIIELDQSCGSTNTGAFSQRSVAVWYVTESANGLGSLQCAGS